MRSIPLIVFLSVLAVLPAAAQQDALREARAARQQRDLPKAVEKYRQALAEAQRASNSAYANIALSEMASVLDQQGDLNEAEKILIELAKPDRLPGQLPALIGLASFYSRHARRADEANTYSRIVKQWSQAAGSKSLGVARYLAEKARAESAAGMMAQSEASFKESLAILKGLSADKTVFGYFVTGSLANSLSVQGRTAEATPFLNDSIEGLDRIMGKVNPLVGGMIGPAFMTAYQSKHSGESNGGESRPVEPTQLSGSNPEYSEAARKARVSGQVTLVLEVTAAGAPGGVWVLKPLGLGLDEKAVEAVRQWRFRPATRNGAAVSTTVTVEVSFSLR